MKRSVFWTLLKVRMKASFSGFMGGAGSQKKSKLKPRDRAILFGLLALYLFGIFAFMFVNYYGQLAGPLHEAGLDWLYFTLFGMTSFLIMFLCTIFATKTQLYEATDNELLLSMPIPPKAILGSRMVMLLLSNILLDLMVGIPALVMWERVAPLSGLGMTAFFLLLLALPFFALAVSCFLGWLIALGSNKARNKSLITVLISLVFLALYFLFVSRANVYITKLVAEKDAIAQTLGKSAPLYWFGNAISGPNIGQLLLTLVILLVPFFVVYAVLSATFISVATKNRGTAKVKYRERAMPTTPVEKALLQREKKHLLSSPVYILNAGLGVLFLYAGGVALIVEKGKLTASLAAMNLTPEMLAVFAVLAVCLICAMVLFTAPSVSLEGKSIWIVKSLPLTSEQILKAKLRLHRRATLPGVLFVTLVCVFTLHVPAALVPGLVLAPCCFVWLSSSLGLIESLKHANLDWINETQVVKQGMAVLFAMLFSALIVIVPGIAYLNLNATVPASVFLYTYTALMAVGAYLCDKWVFTAGTKLFEEIG